MGRPLIEITPEICKKAEQLAAQGLIMTQIAAVLGMGERTLYEKVENYPQFSQAIEAGRAKGIAQVTNALFKKATEGDTAAQKYYLNNRDKPNWKDRIESTVQGSDGGPIKVTTIERVIKRSNNTDG